MPLPKLSSESTKRSSKRKPSGRRWPSHAALRSPAGTSSAVSKPGGKGSARVSAPRFAASAFNRAVSWVRRRCSDAATKSSSGAGTKSGRSAQPVPRMVVMPQRFHRS
ncbi:MAG: hypothetical protein IPJ65_01000 [Archangiaceae bacterium]|nr:hypothetical protein [Archangiaceae bacterium]